MPLALPAHISAARTAPCPRIAQKPPCASEWTTGHWLRSRASSATLSSPGPSGDGDHSQEVEARLEIGTMTPSPGTRPPRISSAAASIDPCLGHAAGTVLRLQVAGTRRPSAGFVASTADWIGYIRTAGWSGQDPGQHGPEHQPRGTDGQLTPAHHGRAAIGALPYHRSPRNGAGVQRVVSPGIRQRHESEASNARTCPRGRAEPIAPPPPVKPDEPGN
jgi:hypothetical protein